MFQLLIYKADNPHVIFSKFSWWGILVDACQNLRHSLFHIFKKASPAGPRTTTTMKPTNKLYHKWLKSLMSNDNNLNCWIQSEVLFTHFLHFSNFKDVKLQDFKTKMTFLSNNHLKVYQKREYSSDKKTYITSNLFVTDIIHDKTHIQEMYTKH